MPVQRQSRGARLHSRRDRRNEVHLRSETAVGFLHNFDLPVGRDILDILAAGAGEQRASADEDAIPSII